MLIVLMMSIFLMSIVFDVVVIVMLKQITLFITHLNVVGLHVVCVASVLHMSLILCLR